MEPLIHVLESWPRLVALFYDYYYYQQLFVTFPFVIYLFVCFWCLLLGFISSLPQQAWESFY